MNSNDYEIINVDFEKYKIKKGYCPGFVYIISEGTEFFKIGWASNVKQRLKDLQIANPRRLQIVKQIQSTNKKDEKIIHYKYHDKKVRGEWFELDSSDIEEIEEYLKNISNEERFEYLSNHTIFDFVKEKEDKKENEELEELRYLYSKF